MKNEAQIKRFLEQAFVRCTSFFNLIVCTQDYLSKLDELEAKVFSRCPAKWFNKRAMREYKKFLIRIDRKGKSVE